MESPQDITLTNIYFGHPYLDAETDISKRKEKYVYPAVLGLLAKYLNTYLCIFKYAHIFTLNKLKPTLTKAFLQRRQWDTKNTQSLAGPGTRISLTSSQQKTKIFHRCRKHKKHVSGKANIRLIQKCFHITYPTLEEKQTQKFLSSRNNYFCSSNPSPTDQTHRSLNSTKVT